MRLALVCVLFFLCAIAPVRSEDGEGLWARFKNHVKDFVDSLKVLFKDLKEEVKMRTADISDWSKEMFDGFKTKMKEWINDAGASDSEKEEMRDYIERLQMPTEENGV